MGNLFSTNMLIPQEKQIIPSIQEMTRYNNSFYLETLSFVKDMNGEYTNSKKILYKTLLENADNEEVINESFKDFFERVKEMIAKFIEFIKSIFARFITMLNSIIKSDKYLVKHKKDFDKFTTAHEFKFDGYTYTIDPIIPVTDIGSVDTAINNIANETTSLDDLKIQYNNFNDNIEAKIDEFRGHVIGQDISIDSSDFDKELFAVYRDGDTETSEITVTKSLVKSAYDDFDGYSKVKSAIEKSKKDIERQYDKLKKDIDKALKLTNGKTKFQFHTKERLDLEGEIKTTIELYVKAISDMVLSMTNVHSLAFSAKLDAAKECFNQDKAILYKALNRIQNTKFMKEAVYVYGTDDPDDCCSAMNPDHIHISDEPEVDDTDVVDDVTFTPVADEEDEETVEVDIEPDDIEDAEDEIVEEMSKLNAIHYTSFKEAVNTAINTKKYSSILLLSETKDSAEAVLKSIYASKANNLPVAKFDQEMAIAAMNIETYIKMLADTVENREVVAIDKVANDITGATDYLTNIKSIEVAVESMKLYHEALVEEKHKRARVVKESKKFSPNYLNAATYVSYLEDWNNNVDTLDRIVKECLLFGSGRSNSSIILELQVLNEGISDNIKKAYNTVKAFITKIFNKFVEASRALFAKESTYLNKYRTTITKQPLKYGYTMKDYRKGINELNTNPLPQLNYESQKADLETKEKWQAKLMGQKGYKGGEFADFCKDLFTGGPDEKEYEPNDPNLNMTDIFNYCMDYKKTEEVIKKDLDTFNKAGVELDKVIKSIQSNRPDAGKVSNTSDEKAGNTEEEKKDEKPDEKVETNPNNTGAAAGGQVQKTGESTMIRNAALKFLNEYNSGEEFAYSFLYEAVISEGPVANIPEKGTDTTPAAGDKKGIGTGAKTGGVIDNNANKTDSQTVKTSVNVAAKTGEKDKREELEKLNDEELKAASTAIDVYNSVARAIITAKQTAAEEIFKGYMSIIRDHVKNYIDTGSKETTVASIATVYDRINNSPEVKQKAIDTLNDAAANAAYSKFRGKDMTPEDIYINIQDTISGIDGLEASKGLSGDERTKLAMDSINTEIDNSGLSDEEKIAAKKVVSDHINFLIDERNKIEATPPNPSAQPTT